MKLSLVAWLAWMTIFLLMPLVQKSIFKANL